jgi:cytidylate kinase
MVLRGRGSQFILKDFADAFHVLIVAPAELRVMRVMQDAKIDEDSAKKEIKRVDDSNREFIKRYFKADLEDSVHYDLVINTGRLAFETAASLIEQAMHSRGRETVIVIHKLGGKYVT